MTVATITVTAMVSAGFPSPSLDIEMYANNQLLSSHHWDAVEKGQSVQDSVELTEVGTWDIFAIARLSNPFGEIEAESPHKTIEIYPTLNPTAWWKCDEGSGTELADSSENENTCTLANISWTEATGRGTKPTFNGVNSEGQVGADTALNIYPKGKITAMCWVYAENVGEGGFGTSFSHYSYSVPTGALGYDIAIWGSAGGTYFQDVTIGVSGTDAYAVSNADFTFRQWNHLAISFDIDGDKKIHFTINGEEKTPLMSIPGVGTIKDDSAVKFGIGYQPWSGYGTWNGYIDDVRVYQDFLTEAEIKAIYDATK